MRTITTLTEEEGARLAERLEDVAEELRDTPQDFSLVLTEGGSGQQHLDLDLEAEVLVGEDTFTLTVRARRGFDGRALTQ